MCTSLASSYIGYKAYLISTIVDRSIGVGKTKGYKAYLISTIVDSKCCLLAKF